MQRVLVVRGLAASAALLLVFFLAGCGGSSNANKVTQVVVTPTALSLNQGGVVGLSAVTEDSSGNTVAADLTFTSSNPAVATVSTAGLVCAGVWDANFINCTPTLGQAGVGQITITVTATAFNVSSTATVYVHEQVDLVQALVGNSCTSMGRAIDVGALAFSTTAPGCSPSAPCDITSTVGPIAFGSNDNLVAATSAGIQSTYSSVTSTPTYVSGGTITGASGQTCNLSNFNSVTGATATVALTGTNVIAAGTQLTITAAGSGATAPATTATLSSGTATCSGTANVNTEITGGVLTAETPGATSVFASVSGVNSVGTPYLTCPVATIFVHAPGGSNTSFTINPQGTQTLTADTFDTNGQLITPTLTWGSSSRAAATVAAATPVNNTATVTGVAGGTAYITASCSYPDCNRAVGAQYSQNVATINVTTPAATTVYAANTNSTSLVPISISGNIVGTPITLPSVPNSILADPGGAFVFMGSDSGVMVLAVASGTVTTIPLVGNVVAVSPDGQYLLASFTAGNNIFYYSFPAGATSATIVGATTSSAYTADSKYNEAVIGDKLEFGIQIGPQGATTLPSPANAMDISAQGGLTYITGAMTAQVAAQIYAYSTCSQSQTQAFANVSSPTLIKALPNGTGAVAADSPDLDVVSTPAMVNPGCPVTTQSTLARYDLGVGSFTAQQILISSDASRAWIVSNLPKLLNFDLATMTPASVTMAGGAIPYNGGITPDGSLVYVGTSDGTVHLINTADMADVAQIAVGLKDGNGTPVPPNMVTVLP